MELVLVFFFYFSAGLAELTFSTISVDYQETTPVREQIRHPTDKARLFFVEFGKPTFYKHRVQYKDPDIDLSVQLSA